MHLSNCIRLICYPYFGWRLLFQSGWGGWLGGDEANKDILKGVNTQACEQLFAAIRHMTKKLSLSKVGVYYIVTYLILDHLNERNTSLG